ncbi:MAG TPA: response regulator transcription factor [Gaiellaceae bacterium]|nr:response regulator transcription factor [Gaiellaceae bacterium]
MSSSTPKRPLRVLLVDDDPVFRELMAFVLRAHAGAEIVGQASDGAEGVELARSLHPDVVVMDLRMPKMDGFEATRKICTAVPDARVLVVSSSTERDDIERATRAGAAAYLPKDRVVADAAGEIARLRPPGAEGRTRYLNQLFARRLVLG